MTKIKTEQPDSDLQQHGYTALTKSQLQAGTQSQTAVATEQPDRDRQSETLAVPRSATEMGTSTMTFVRAEGADEDPGHIVNQIVPRCS